MKKLSSVSIYKTSQRLDLCWFATLLEQNNHAGKKSSLKKKVNKNIGTDVFPDVQERDAFM